MNFKIVLLVAAAVVILLWLVYQDQKEKARAEGDREYGMEDFKKYLLCQNDPDPKEPELSLEAKSSKTSEKSEVLKKPDDQAEKAKQSENEALKDVESGTESGSTPKDSENETEDGSSKKASKIAGSETDAAKDDPVKTGTTISKMETKKSETLYGFLNLQDDGSKNLIFMGSKMLSEVTESLGYFGADGIDRFALINGGRLIESIKLTVDLSDYKFEERTELKLVEGKVFSPAVNGVRNFVGEVKPAKCFGRPEGGNLFTISSQKMAEIGKIPGMNAKTFLRNVSRVEGVVAEVRFTDGSIDHLEIPPSIYSGYKNPAPKKGEEKTPKEATKG